MWENIFSFSKVSEVEQEIGLVGQNAKVGQI
jgi:hypothetical protein